MYRRKFNINDKVKIKKGKNAGRIATVKGISTSWGRIKYVIVDENDKQIGWDFYASDLDYAPNSNTQMLNNEPKKEVGEKVSGLSLIEARELYKSGGRFREIALRAYPEDELKVFLPMTWQEFCDKYPIGDNEYYIHGSDGSIRKSAPMERNEWADTAVLPSKELAEGFKAYMQLVNLCIAWANGWKPTKGYYYIKSGINEAIITYEYNENVKHALAFQNQKLANAFGKAFKEYLIKANGLY